MGQKLQYFQTKVWRQKQKWYKNGKSNECEKYQISIINKILKNNLSKTIFRLHLEKLLLEENRNPLSKEDGYDWSETFDGI